MLRSRKNWKSGVIERRTSFGTVERLTIVLHQGKTLRADTPWLSALSDRQRRELFEEVS